MRAIQGKSDNRDDAMLTSDAILTHPAAAPDKLRTIRPLRLHVAAGHKRNAMRAFTRQRARVSKTQQPPPPARVRTFWSSTCIASHVCASPRIIVLPTSGATGATTSCARPLRPSSAGVLRGPPPLVVAARPCPRASSPLRLREPLVCAHHLRGMERGELRPARGKKALVEPLSDRRHPRTSLNCLLASATTSGLAPTCRSGCHFRASRLNAARTSSSVAPRATPRTECGSDISNTSRRVSKLTEAVPAGGKAAATRAFCEESTSLSTSLNE